MQTFLLIPAKLQNCYFLLLYIEITASKATKRLYNQWKLFSSLLSKSALKVMLTKSDHDQGKYCGPKLALCLLKQWFPAVFTIFG